MSGNSNRTIPGDSGATQDSSPSRNATVLLVDSDAGLLEKVNGWLKPNYHTILANDGEEAFSKAQHFLPDLILSANMLSKLNGVTLVDKLKGQASTQHIPVILMANRPGEDGKESGLQAGADHYFTSPVDEKELLDTVSTQIAIAGARRKTEKEFYNLFAQSPAYIDVMKGPDHVFEFFHPRGIEVVGRDITGMKARDGLAHIAIEGFFEMLDRVFNEGITVRSEEAKAVVTGADGNPIDRYFDVTYSPYRDPAGAIQGIMIFSIEVTEQVKARQKIHDSEERLRIATGVLELGTWEFDPVSDQVFCSDKTIELFGFEPGREKIRFEDFMNVIDAEDIARVRQSVEWAMNPESMGKYDIEYAIHTNNGERRMVRANGKVLFNAEQKPFRFVGTLLDITERKRSEQEMRESEQRFRLLATSIPQMVWTTDSEGTTNYISDRFEEYTGLKATESNENWSNALHPDDRELLLSRRTDGRIKKQGWNGEYRFRDTRTGRYRWFWIDSRPLLDENGNVLMWVGSGSDIQHLKEQSSWLEQQVQQRTRALKEINESLQMSNDDLQQFAHVASHDLKEPVRKIMTYGNRFLDECRDQLNEKSKLFLSKILGAADRIASMIDGVLSYSMLTAHSQPPQPIDLNSIFDDIVSDLELLINEKSATIERDELPIVSGAAVLIYQLFYNLINNSIKFSKKDTPPVIRITCEPIDHDERPFTRITISDNGIGFGPSQSEHIFSTFTRLHSKDDFEGTGLGLALCRKIAHRHGGTITARGEMGKGAQFIILLPLV